MSELNRLMLRQLAGVKRHYEAVAPRMDGLPLCHEGLEIEVRAAGWCPFETEDGLQGRGLLAGVVTPWCLNALLLPAVWPLRWPRHTGAEVEVSLPAGCFVMLVNEGGFLSLSLLAEPRQLEDQAAARAFMEAALAMLNTPEAVEAPARQERPAGMGLQAALEKPVSRRGLFGGA